jgi:hypothetical protein
MSIVLLLVCLIALTPGRATAAELDARTSRAYDAYLEQAKRNFLSRVLSGVAVGPGRIGIMSARPAREDGIIGIGGGLIHDWIGTAFIRGSTLTEVVSVSQAYSDYTAVYKSIILSRLLEQQGDTYRVLVRLKEGQAGVSAVLQIRSTVQYTVATSGRVYALSNADEIREVKGAGRRDEQLLPPGRDSGYLWRANTFTLFLQQQDGVYVETEMLGLSRQFPALLGWIIEPIARRLGRKSVETSLRELAAAVH